MSQVDPDTIIYGTSGVINSYRMVTFCICDSPTCEFCNPEKVLAEGDVNFKINKLLKKAAVYFRETKKKKRNAKKPKVK